jgi:hypothetical protein
VSHLPTPSRPARGALSLAAALMLVLVTAAPSRGQNPNPPIPGGGLFEFDLGASFMRHGGHPPIEGVVAAQQPLPAGQDTWTSFKISALVMANRHLALGLEVGGWVLRAGGSNEYGVSAVPAFVTARIYPFRTVPLHLRVSGGFVAWREDGPHGYNETGLGYEAGIGYDVRIHGHSHLTPFVLYAAARPGDISMHTVTVGVGFARW